MKTRKTTEEWPLKKVFSDECVRFFLVDQHNFYFVHSIHNVMLKFKRMAQRTQYTVEKHNTIRNLKKKRVSTE